MPIRLVVRLFGLLGLMGTLIAVPSAAGAAGTARVSVVSAVWTEPQSGYGFLDDAIEHARTTIDLSMYALEDTTTEKDLIARTQAKVNVRVILNADYEGKHDNQATFNYLRAHGVQVVWAPAGQTFHAKYLIVGHSAYVGTGNLQSKYYSSTRDFWMKDANASDVGAMAQTFNNDFIRNGAAPMHSHGLVWSPGSTSALLRLIGSAKHTLLVENEEMDSPSIESALSQAAQRGVAVNVVMTESSDWTAALGVLARNGVHVHVLNSSQVYIHAKVICADCTTSEGTAFVGSENFSTSSLSYNRELGLVTSSLVVVRAVATALNADYASGAPVGASAPAPVATLPPAPSSGGPVAITSFRESVSPGAEDSLSAHSSRPRDVCSLRVTLPSGYVSQSRGLGPAKAAA
ncbi:MAG: phospholipase D-like domain-containing protein, partial [Acidimicrobiales bacterium]